MLGHEILRSLILALDLLLCYKTYFCLHLEINLGESERVGCSHLSSILGLVFPVKRER